MPDGHCQIWVLDEKITNSTRERLGDARCLADELQDNVGVLLIGPESESVASLAHYGADQVTHIIVPEAGPNTRVELSLAHLTEQNPRLILASGDPAGREWAARLAARAGWRLLSPALLAQVEKEEIVITALSYRGRFCRKIPLPSSETALITLKPGVAEVPSPNTQRQAQITQYELPAHNETVKLVKEIPADPKTVDISYAKRLVAGGRGLGSPAGFATLEPLADCLKAGIAASRVAVDLGWISRERQVGQTGKTVQPELYMACGISGASHHLAGMSDAKHIIAINIDPEAPIFKVAHLGLVADLYPVLETVAERIT